MPNGKFQVMENRCDQCLYSKDRIVSQSRMRELLKSCKAKDTHFICHKSTIAGQEVCCRGFYDANPQGTNLMRLAERLGVLEFTDERGISDKQDPKQ